MSDKEPRGLDEDGSDELLSDEAVAILSELNDDQLAGPDEAELPDGDDGP